MTRSPSGAWTHAALLVTMLLYGGSFVAMKAAVNVLDPWLIVLARMLLAVAAFSVFLGRFPPVAHVGRHLPKLLAMALSEPCLYFVFEAKALTLTQASQAGTITALLPVMVACSAGFFLGERTSPKAWAGLVLGLAGAVTLSAASAPQPYSPDPILGNTLEFAAMVCATAYTLLVRHLARHFPALFLTAFQVAVGAVFFSPALVFSPWPGTVTWQALAAVAFLGLGVSVGAYGLYNHCLSRLPAPRVAQAVNLIPAVSLLMGWAFLGETVQGLQWAGVGLIGLGAVIGARAGTG